MNERTLTNSERIGFAAKLVRETTLTTQGPLARELATIATQLAQIAGKLAGQSIAVIDVRTEAQR